MTEQQKATADTFFDLANALADSGRWTSEMQEIMDDLTTGASSPDEAIEALRKVSED